MSEPPIAGLHTLHRPERVAVVAVHGVADQVLGATARQVAGLLANGPGLGASYQTRTCDSFITQVPLIEPMSDGRSTLAAPELAGGEANPAEPVGLSQKAMHQSLRSDFQRPNWRVQKPSGTKAPTVPTTAGNQDISDRGVEFTDYLLFKAIAKTESEAYEAPRIRMTRHDAQQSQDVDVYEMYWADLSRLSSSLPRIVTEFFTLIFRLSRLGRDTVDEASRAARTALEHNDADVKAAQQSIRRWSRLASTQIALDWAFSALLANLFVQLLVAGLFIAALGASRPYAPIIHAVLAYAGPALALWWVSYRHALARPSVMALAVVFGGVAWLLLLVPPQWVIGPVYLVLLALLCDACLRIADERFPSTRRTGWIFLAGTSLVIVGFTIYGAWQAAGGLEHWIRASMRAVEYLLVGVVAWWGVVPIVMAAWLFNGELAARDSDADRASVATGRLGMLVSLASFLAVVMTMWAMLRKLFEMGAQGVAYAPQVFTMAPDRVVDGAAFLAQRYTSSTETFALVGGACFLLILYLVVVMTPSVLAELKRPIGTSRTLGHWLSAGYRHLNGFVGLLAAIGVVAACVVGALLLMARFGVGQSPALAQWTEQVAIASRNVLAPLVISAATALAILSGFGKVLSRHLPGIRAPLDAALDVDNHFREFPRRAIPRARIFARYVALLEHVAAQGYDRVVIVSHSQGTVISTELLRYLKHRAEVQAGKGKKDDRILRLWTELTGRVQLLTAGCPLRQLYAARFPELYGWVVRDHGGLSGPQAKEVGVERWVNVYTTGDYVGRWLWCDPPPAVDTLARQPTLFDEQKKPEVSEKLEIDVCLGAGAHTHYFEQHDPRVAGWIDALIAEPSMAMPDQPFHPDPSGAGWPAMASFDEFADEWLPAASASMSFDLDLGDVDERAVSRPTASAPKPPPTHTLLTVWFGTDREPGKGSSGHESFGNVRASGSDPIAYGYARVSIPALHKEGEVDRPRWWRLEFSLDPQKHMVLENVVSLPLDVWRVDACKKGAEGLLFVHGFNVSFEEAMLRTAQLAYDLKFSGVPLCYSWASAAQVGSYMHDEQTVEWSTEHLRAFLETISQDLGLSRIHLIAHSMGNRALTRILSEWTPESADIIGEIVMAAPDVDSGLFQNLVRRCKVGRQLTLYASRADRAIKASKLLHAYARAGDGDPPLVMQGICTVDVTSAGEEMFGLGHGYFSGNSVFTDLYYLIRLGLKPTDRKSIRATDDGYFLLA